MKNIMIDAKEGLGHIMDVGGRGCGKTQLRMAYQMAYFESLEIGEPVSLERGYEIMWEKYDEIHREK